MQPDDRRAPTPAPWRIDPAEWAAYEALRVLDYAATARHARRALRAYLHDDDRRGRMTRLLVMLWREMHDAS